MPQIKLSTLICNVTHEKNKDEVFLIFNGKRLWPKKVKYRKIGVDDKEDIDIVGSFKNGWIEIELWDFDYTKKNNHLGTFHLEITDDPGQFGSILSLNEAMDSEADYTLNWEILPSS